MWSHDTRTAPGQRTRRASEAAPVGGGERGGAEAAAQEAIPRVTIVIPVHNAANYLSERLDCVLEQTMREIEVICVDDGSTDGSLSILREYAAKDERMLVVGQENAGPAAARNRGLELARGEWVTFFDADDYCKRDLFSTVLAGVDAATGAGRDVDVAIFPERSHNVTTGADAWLDYAFQSGNFPDGVFTWRDNPDRILLSFQNWLHNKLFRLSFVREHGLRLQSLHHTEDMLFTCSALLLARGIICVPGSCAYYRIGMQESQLHANAKWPLDFYEACLALRNFIARQSLTDPLRRGYLNLAGNCVLSNVDLMDDPAGMRKIYDTLHGGGLARLGLADAAEEDFDNPDDYRRLACLATQTYEDFLVEERFHNFQRWHEEHESLVAIVNSRSFSIGRTLTGLPRRIRDLVFRATGNADALARRFPDDRNS
jgi:glycosyltransferase involved in cell wall biosynthesis